MPQLADPQIAPDGSAVVYTVKTPDWENNRYDTEIFVSLDGATPVQLKDNENGSSSDPEWSPDSQLSPLWPTAAREHRSTWYLLPAETLNKLPRGREDF